MSETASPHESKLCSLAECYLLYMYVLLPEWNPWYADGYVAKTLSSGGMPLVANNANSIKFLNPFVEAQTMGVQ